MHKRLSDHSALSAEEIRAYRTLARAARNVLELEKRRKIVHRNQARSRVVRDAK